MRNPFRRRGEGTDTRAEQLRAARLDDALTDWQHGHVPAEAVSLDEDAQLDGEPFGDELAAAQRLHRYAESGRSAPHEPLVALRAAIAARRAMRQPAWRGLLVSNRMAPALAVIALVVGTLVGLNLVRPGSEPRPHVPTELAGQPQSIALLTEQAQVKLDELQTVITQPNVAPEVVTKAYEDAYAAVQQAKTALQVAPAGRDGDVDVKVLAARVQTQQKTMDQLRQELAKAKLLPAQVSTTIDDLLGAQAATSTTDTATPTTSGASAGSSSTRPSSSTTRQPQPTTTVAPTTTQPITTTAPTTPSTTTTTTPPPGDVGPASGTETVGF